MGDAPAGRIKLSPHRRGDIALGTLHPNMVLGWPARPKPDT